MVPDAHGANTANRNAATVTVAGGCVIRIWINRKFDITVLNKMKSDVYKRQPLAGDHAMRAAPGEPGGVGFL